MEEVAKEEVKQEGHIVIDRLGSVSSPQHMKIADEILTRSLQ